MYDALKFTLKSTLAFLIGLITPVNGFIIAILTLAVINVIFGISADKRFSFKKAYHAFIYLIGYLFLILLTVLVAELVKVDIANMLLIIRWYTAVLIWFYGTNILRNWNLIQPENKVISFLYWVLSFKIVEKIKFLKEFNERKDAQ